MYSKHVTELLYGIWSIDKEIAEYYLASFLHSSDFFSRDYSSERADNRPALFSFDSEHNLIETDYDNQVAIPEKSVAVVKLSGVISKYDKTCGPEGVTTSVKRIREFASKPEISSIVLHINSPGGESNAANYMASEIQSIRSQKPVIAFVDDLCCSAAYWIASSCEKIGVNTELATIGSIGTYTTIKNYQRMFEKEGIDVTELYASASTEKNIEFREAIKGNFEKLQNDLDFYNDYFIKNVLENRPGLAKSNDWKTGKKYFAQEALQKKLIDFITPFNHFIENILQ